MGTEEKPMPRALMTPGREDLSPWPPVGQLDFEKITAMDEATLDRAFKERHGLAHIFKKGKHHEPYSRAEQEGRRVEIKRIVLARLEGYSGSGKELWSWYDSVDVATEDPNNSLRVTLSSALNDECKVRIRDVNAQISREVAMMVPPVAVQDIKDQIDKKFQALKLDKLSIKEIFGSKKLPSYGKQYRGKTTLDLKNALAYFLMELEGYSLAECASRFKTSTDSLKQLKSIYFSERAKDAILKSRDKGR